LSRLGEGVSKNPAVREFMRGYTARHDGGPSRSKGGYQHEERMRMARKGGDHSQQGVHRDVLPLQLWRKGRQKDTKRTVGQLAPRITISETNIQGS